MTILFDSLHQLWPILLVTPLSYFSLIIMLRISGKRSLSKLNAFDFIVTVALGSTLAATITAESVSFAEGMLVLVLLILMQYLITWLSVRLEFFNNLIKSKPLILYIDAEFRQQNMTIARINKQEVFQSIREAGFASLEQVEAVILEPNGNMSVIAKFKGAQRSALPS